MVLTSLDRPEANPLFVGSYYLFIAALFLLYVGLDWFVDGPRNGHLFWLGLGMYFFARSLSMLMTRPFWME